MNPSQLERLVKDHQAQLLADRGRGRRAGRSPGSLTHLVRRGLEKTGYGLIRVGVRLAGPEPLAHGPRSGGIGDVRSRSGEAVAEDVQRDYAMAGGGPTPA
jgi:hypothetical protein